MKPTPCPRYATILEALRPLARLARGFEGTLFRCVETAFAHDLVSGVGARIHGGRWNPKGAFPVVYLCDSPETALAEYLARSRRMCLPDARALPMVMAAVEVRVGAALDLDAPEAATILQPLLAVETDHWRTVQGRREAVSQAVGRALRSLGVQTVIPASRARAGGRTFAVFPDRLTGADRLAAPVLRGLS
jgi:RES domain-containing protein